MPLHHLFACTLHSSELTLNATHVHRGFQPSQQQHHCEPHYGQELWQESSTNPCPTGQEVRWLEWSADVEGGDQQVDKWGRAVLQTRTNTVHPCASLCLPM